MTLFWMTRPSEQAEPLHRALTAQNIEVIDSPLSQIKPHQAAALHFDPYVAADITIYTSVNAVHHCPMAYERSLAIGLATEAALKEKGMTLLAPPKAPYHSEQLLQSVHLQVNTIQGKTVRLVKGVGGRGLLRDQLMQRGAAVQIYDVYQQAACPVDPSTLERFACYQGETLVLAMSQFTLLAFEAGRHGDIQHLKARATLLCVSGRVAEYARQRGWQKIKCAASASQAGILSIINA